jgi:tRNA pseudouridine38-40 synthase
MARYLMKLCYDGTNYHGWQKQHNGISIQAVLEGALETFAEAHVPIIAAGRTDAGVHALAQFAHFDYEGSMQPYQMLLAFRRYLPADIKVLEIGKVNPMLSARYQAYERSYRYILAKYRTPFNRNYGGFIPSIKLNLAPMQAAAVRLLGSHDFSSFGRANPEIPNRICEIKILNIKESEESFEFIITADRFLHNMVRRIVGTLANISHFSLPPETIDAILSDTCPRQNLVTTAPASGLYLIDVKYPASLLDETSAPEILGI